MGALADDLRAKVRATFKESWNISEAQKVPDTQDIRLDNHGKKLNATVLYSDIADSTGLIRDYPAWFAAEVSKTFLYCCVKLIRHFDGSVTSFDGDRVMAVFHGNSKNSNAGKTALRINYAVKKIIQPYLDSHVNKYEYKLQHCTGVDTGELLAVRPGIRNNNDLIWLGRAANYAAVLSDVRSGVYRSYMTSRVYDKMNQEVKKSDEDKDMWVEETVGIKGYNVRCYKSSWRWGI